VGQRRRAREYALQMLFQIDLSGGPPDSVFPDFWGSQDAPEDVRAFAERLVRGACSHQESLDAAIADAAQRWRIERMATVDRNVLRLATFELMFEDDTPSAVILDEAIEIVKKYGSEDSGRYINGILDGIRKKVESGELGMAPGRGGPG